MGKFIDETGKKYNKLTVLHTVRTTKKVMWLCQCDCGKLTVVEGGSLRSAKPTKSCGCANSKKHKFIGDFKSNHPLFPTWSNMMSRCRDKGNVSYKYYGGRGIIVCQEWKDNFWKFVEDMGSKPTNKHTVERINNEGNYSKFNCKWALPKEQRINQRKTTKNA